MVKKVTVPSHLWKIDWVIYYQKRLQHKILFKGREVVLCVKDDIKPQHKTEVIFLEKYPECHCPNDSIGEMKKE